MMKFKSLFRRGQQSHPPPSSQHQQQQSIQQQQLQNSTNQLQQVQPRQASQSYASTLESRAAGSQSQQQQQQSQLDNRTSGVREASRNHAAKSATKGLSNNSSRMQELERELELSRKERARLEACVRESAAEAKRLDELRNELAAIKVYRFSVVASHDQLFS